MVSILVTDVVVSISPLLPLLVSLVPLVLEFVSCAIQGLSMCMLLVHFIVLIVSNFFFPGHVTVVHLLLASSEYC